MMGSLYNGDRHSRATSRSEVDDATGSGLLVDAFEHSRRKDGETGPRSLSERPWCNDAPE